MKVWHLSELIRSSFIIQLDKIHFCFHVCIRWEIHSLFYRFLNGVFLPTREFFTQMETSPLPVKGCKIWPMLGNYGHWAVRVLTFISHLLPSVWIGAVTTCFNDLGLSWLGFESQTFRFQGERSNRS